MGLYDWIWIEIECPNCRNKSRMEFQTHDLGRTYREFKLGDRLDVKTPMSLLGSCRNCHCSMDAWGNIENEILRNVEIFRYTINLGKTIKFNSLGINMKHHNLKEI